MLPINQLATNGNLPLDEQVLGSLALGSIYQGFQWQQAAWLKQCEPIDGLSATCKGIKATLSHALGFSDLPVRFYLFDLLSPYGNVQRHALVLIDKPAAQGLSPEKLLTAFSKNKQGTGMPAELFALTEMSYEQPYLLFSTLDYTQPEWVTSPFPPDKDAAFPPAFLSTIKPSVKAGFNGCVSVKLASDLAVPDSSNSIPIAPLLSTVGLGSLGGAAFPCNMAISEALVGYRVSLWKSVDLTAEKVPLKPSLTGVGIDLLLGTQELRLPDIHLQGHLSIGGPAGLDLNIGLYPESQLLHIAFSHLPTFEQLSRLFSSTPFQAIISEGLPAGAMEALGQITVEELSFSVALSATPMLSNIALSISTEHPLELTTGIRFKPLLKVSIDHPTAAASRKSTFEIIGLCNFTGATLGTMVSHTREPNPGDSSTMLMAQLMIGTGVNATAFMDSWMVGTGLLLPQIELSDLEFVAVKTTDTTSIDFELDVSGLWMIEGTNLGLDGVSLELQAQKSQSHWEITTASATGTVLVGPAHFYTSANYDSDGRSWTFSSGTTPGSQLALGDFVNAIANDLRLPASRTFIDELNRVVVDECFFQYQTSQSSGSSFQFVLAAQTSVNFHGLPLQNISLNLSRDGAGTTFILQASAGSDNDQGQVGNGFQALSNHYAQGVAMPDSVAQSAAQIKTLTASVDNANHAFSFEITAAFSIADILKELDLIDRDQTVTAPQKDAYLRFAFSKDPQQQEVSNTTFSLGIAGALTLRQLSGLAESLPEAFDPQLDFIEFDYSLERTAEERLSKVVFKLFFSIEGEAGKPKRQCLLEGIRLKKTQTTVLVGTIRAVDGKPIQIDLGNDFPFQTGLENLYVGRASTSTTDKIPFYGAGFEVTGNLSLASLPVVGQFLADAQFSVNSVRMLYVDKPISETTLELVNQGLTDIKVQPLNFPNEKGNSSSTTFPEGFSISGELVLGDADKPLLLGGPITSTGGNNGNATINTQQAHSPTTPTPVGKQYGPVTIQSVALGMAGGQVHLNFTGSLQIGPLALHLLGFELSSPVNEFKPSLSINGLGLDLSKPPLEVSGLLQKSDQDGIDIYTGEFVVGYEKYGLGGEGSYATLPDGSASLFLYAFLEAPLGGPPYCFVTGAAAGFGYNRGFRLPQPTTVQSHPLIQPILGTSATSFEEVDKVFAPAAGSFWGAVGIRATSFKMVESFVLLALRETTELEIDVIGLSQMEYPVCLPESKVPPLARVTVGLVARVLPERGVISVNGALQPGSYVYNPLAHISGGFGMVSFSKDQVGGPWDGAREGEFIFTMGGYAPEFKPKPYYPQPARLELTWQVNNNMSLKAQAYFAITPKVMMAGGGLQANFQAGGSFFIHVYFTADANFIIYWKPYHYRAQMHAQLSVDACVSVDLLFTTIHQSIHFDMGAGLNIWGPSFSGNAHVTVHFLVSFSVDVSFGQAIPDPQPIGWDEFQKSFLPEKDQILVANITKGRVPNGKAGSVPVVNPKEIEITCQTAIPEKQDQSQFGIKSMGKTIDDIEHSEMVVSIKKGELDVKDHFVINKRSRNLPSALWQPAAHSGEISTTDPHDPVMELLCSMEITAKTPAPEGGVTIESQSLDVIKTPVSPEQAPFTYSSTRFKPIISAA